MFSLLIPATQRAQHDFSGLISKAGSQGNGVLTMCEVQCNAMHAINFHVILLKDTLFSECQEYFFLVSAT